MDGGSVMVDFGELSRLARTFIQEHGGIERLTGDDDEIDFDAPACCAYEVIQPLGKPGE
jgi:hypothetical protein